MSMFHPSDSDTCERAAYRDSIAQSKPTTQQLSGCAKAWRSMVALAVYVVAVSPLLVFAGLLAAYEWLERADLVQRYLDATDRLHWRLRTWVEGRTS